MKIGESIEDIINPELKEMVQIIEDELHFELVDKFYRSVIPDHADQIQHYLDDAFAD